MEPLSSYTNQLKMDSVPTHRPEIENTMEKMEREDLQTLDWAGLYMDKILKL